MLPPPHCDSLRQDFSAIKLKSTIKNKAKVAEFLKQHNMQNRPLVVVVPFVHTTHHNLTLDGWCEAINILAQDYPHICFAIPTYKNNANIDFPAKNIAVFHNDSDLLNIVALLESSSLIIAPSTGISHIANNLGMDIIWLCSKRDKNLWSGDSMKEELFIILKNPTTKMTQQEEKDYITQIKQKFKNLAPSLRIYKAT